MQTFELILSLLLGAVVLSGIARRLCLPYPAFLALGGAAIALLPTNWAITLDPHLALALFVAPVLLDAAYDTSLRDLKRDWRAVGMLVVFAVGVTTAAVAVVARLMVPGMPWAAAVALGAIVAPPDAAAAAAVLRQLRLPHRLTIILEGESLLNDASSLLIYRAAVLTAAAGEFHAAHMVPMFTLGLLGSIVAGVGLAWLMGRIMRSVEDVPTSVVLQFIGTFGVWILAERLELSGILTVVVFGVTLARNPQRTPARLRVPSYAVWETVVFVMNVLAFLLIGMQLDPIWARLSPSQHHLYLAVAGVVLAVVIVARFACVFGSQSAVRLLRRTRDTDRRAERNQSLLVSWCGMRGIVTLAAALALPDGGGEGPGGQAFPYRDLIVLCAFATVLGTLLIQGFTLRPLLKRLQLPDDGLVDREFNHARTRALHAATGALQDDHSPQADSLRREYEQTLQSAAQTPRGQLPDRLPNDALRDRALAASRQALVELRDAGEIGDAAFHRLEERLDLLELSLGRVAEET